MGLKDWFPFLRRKGYEPSVIPPSVIAGTLGNRTGRLDVLSFYPVIRNAYSHQTLDQAHLILEKTLSRFGTKESLILYIDGGQAVEKQETTRSREAAREKAAVKCQQSLDVLEQRIINNEKARKRHFVDVKTNLSSTFYWSSSARQSFVDHLRQAGWNVKLCETEADVAIASDCQPGDIVISADSDMLAYGPTLWRPVSKGLVLAYNRAELCRILGFSSAQLTALACVSSNDYNKNVYSLGPSTNFSIIRLIGQSGRQCNKKEKDYILQPLDFAVEFVLTFILFFRPQVNRIGVPGS